MSIGLAVFDQNHRLLLFNPDLVDLTSFEAEFLSGRPVLTHLFSKLREHRTMLEPRNSAASCKSWFSVLIKALIVPLGNCLVG